MAKPENDINEHMNHTAVNLDPIDKKILELLQEDGKRSLQDIVELLEKDHITSNISTVKRHIDRLKENGVIKDTIAVVDCCRVGYREMLILSLRVNTRVSMNHILEDLNKIKEINCIYQVSGNYPILVMAKCVEKENEIHLIEEIKKVDGVEEIITQVVLRRVKEDMRVKIP